LDNSSSLSIQVIARPVKDSSPIEQRVLWYWDPQSEEVEQAPVDFHLFGTGAQHIALEPTDNADPPPLLLASTVNSVQNVHTHALLSYGIDASTSPPAGAYGFFAQLTSSHYAVSNPFLVVFNRGVDNELLVDAGLAINAAAVDPGLAGDFNHDGAVNAADYVVWRKPLSTDGGYAEWQTNFGRTVAGRGASRLPTTVPEPAVVCLLAHAAGLLVGAARRRG
jgi:hypothetical protein